MLAFGAQWRKMESEGNHLMRFTVADFMDVKPGVIAKLARDADFYVGAADAATDRLVFDEKERVGAWVAAQAEQTAPWGSFYALGIERRGELIAGIVINGMNGSNATVHFAVKRLSKSFVALVHHGADYCFRQCGLRRVTGLVESDNAKALALDAHLGFEHEFTMKRAGSKGQDVEVLVFWREHWEDQENFLRRKR